MKKNSLPSSSAGADYQYLVELRWEKGKDTSYFWNEACAWAVENFGLPGGRYVTHPTPDYMLFRFRHSEDAVMMTLKWT